MVSVVDDAPTAAADLASDLVARQRSGDQILVDAGTGWCRHRRLTAEVTSPSLTVVIA
jgi:hypothetical protein